jgi:hypothetical protein
MLRFASMRLDEWSPAFAATTKEKLYLRIN